MFHLTLPCAPLVQIMVYHLLINFPLCVLRGNNLSLADRYFFIEQDISFLSVLLLGLDVIYDLDIFVIVLVPRVGSWASRWTFDIAKIMSLVRRIPLMHYYPIQLINILYLVIGVLFQHIIRLKLKLLRKVQWILQLRPQMVKPFYMHYQYLRCYIFQWY